MYILDFLSIEEEEKEAEEGDEGRRQRRKSWRRSNKASFI